jgi:hypothetical protein
MVTEVTRSGKVCPDVTKESILSLARRKTEPKRTVLSYSLDVTEEQLYQFFVMVVKAKLHLSPFFAIEPPATFYPGTVKFEPPIPFAVSEVDHKFVLKVEGDWTWRAVYVIIAVFENLEAWVKSEPGQRRVSVRKRIKRVTFTDIFLKGVIKSIADESARAPAAVPVAAGETSIEDDDVE